ncbi:unnamed protein product [Closterium sp. Yama58-4]|nr:unnamed protein product [Closterium sp. Yama58-4]
MFPTCSDSSSLSHASSDWHRAQLHFCVSIKACTFTSLKGLAVATVGTFHNGFRSKIESGETNPAHSGVASCSFMHLHRNRDSIGEAVVSMDMDLLTLVTVIFPNSLADDHRHKIVARVKATLHNNQFTSSKVPNFESLAGENLHFPRKTYAHHVFQWLMRVYTHCFRKALLIAYRPLDGSYIDIKSYVDPEPEFTAAKANGENHLLLCNILIGYSLDAVKKMLLSQRNKSGRKWLRDVKLLHKILDLYEEVYHPKMAGLPVAEDDDRLFEQVPTVI